MNELCEASMTGAHDIDRRGLCRWCERRVAGPVAAPRPLQVERSELTEAYEYAFDPDWGA